MKFNIISSVAFAVRGHRYGRLDAEYVDRDILSVETRLKSQYHGSRLDTLWDEAIGTYRQPQDAGDALKIYVAIDDIDERDGFLFHQSLAEAELPGRARYRLKPFDIVLSNVRPERGAVGMLLASQAGAIGSSGLTVVRIDSRETRNVTFAYLRSQIVQNQLIRRSRGSMYPAVTKDDVAEIIVPTLPASIREAIDAAVEKSLLAKQRFFDVSLEQAEALEAYLADSLGPPPPDIVLDIAKKLPVQVAKRSDFFNKGANRFDAEFHRKEFIDFEQHLLSSSGIVRLGDSYEAFAGGNPGKGAKTLYRLRQAQLSGFGLHYGGCEAVDASNIAARMLLREGDVLIGCTAHEPHYVGNRVDIVDELPASMVNAVAPVADVMILRQRPDAEGPTPQFLAAFLKSVWGRRQFQRLNRGVRGGHVYGQDVEAFIHVPTPPAHWMAAFNKRQNEIRFTRRHAITAMNDATSLVDQTLKS